MKKLLKFTIFVAVVYVFLYVNNHWLVTTELVHESEKIPSSFDGYRIVQISDLHDATFGGNQAHLVEKVRKSKPDVIFLTGDLVDSRRYDLQNSLQAVEQFVEIADVYYVLGNHEVALNKVNEIYATLRELGVHVLSNDAMVVERDGERIAILGIEDPLMGKAVDVSIDEAMQNVDENLFTVLLSHRPEQFETYVDKEMDLVFTGHAHGGQIRLPLIGGLVAPTQGLLPKYSAGIFNKNDSKMIISRGLGNSLFPFRIFNLPEVIVVELNSK
ncbi:phosphoesterase [Lysinibacillus sp. 2017]|uniref:metallophosphoesterase n=1 Tax=unclassified Lysinibacillus TaxID=2636778 RepID=UPI000D526D34|nr:MULTISPECIES: metallophosphoesterase [unclassified Lysinibacillus]AWE06012.1 phosphoesterase [Lysinibacillus sp. 2017]TGN34795.1 metallophosphoesterase [Lysinibacillus sp. S2017]